MATIEDQYKYIKNQIINYSWLVSDDTIADKIIDAKKSQSDLTYKKLYDLLTDDADIKKSLGNRLEKIIKKIPKPAKIILVYPEPAKRPTEPHELEKKNISPKPKTLLKPEISGDIYPYLALLALSGIFIFAYKR
jgi:hypothetical protein